MIQLYREGLTCRQLAARFGIHRTTVLEHLKQAGVERRINTRKLRDADVLRARQLYEGGQSLASVATSFNVDPETIRREFIKARIPIRARRGWGSRERL